MKMEKQIENIVTGGRGYEPVGDRYIVSDELLEGSRDLNADVQRALAAMDGRDGKTSILLSNVFGGGVTENKPVNATGLEDSSVYDELAVGITVRSDASYVPRTGDELVRDLRNGRLVLN